MSVLIYNVLLSFASTDNTTNGIVCEIYIYIYVYTHTHTPYIYMRFLTIYTQRGTNSPAIRVDAWEDCPIFVVLGTILEQIISHDSVSLLNGFLMSQLQKSCMDLHTAKWVFWLLQYPEYLNYIAVLKTVFQDVKLPFLPLEPTLIFCFSSPNSC